MSIAQLEKQILKITQSQKLLMRAKKAMAVEAVRLAKRGFATSTNPYGTPWKPLKYRVGKPLVKTGKLRRYTWGLREDGFYLIAGAEYWSPHQFGTSHIPKRQIFPNANGWGQWAHPMKAAALKSIRRWFNG